MNRYCYDNLLNHVTESGEQLCTGTCPLHATIHDGIKREAEVYLHHKNGHRVKIGVRTIPVLDGENIVGAIEAFSQLPVNGNFLMDENTANNFFDSLEQIRSLALHDQLTLLPNRRYLENKLETKLAEYNNLNIPFGVLFVDIDFFRDVNNNYGHDTGDKVLQMISKTFLNATRDTDMVGRWGGEEFLAIISPSDKESLAYIAERMRMLTEKSVLRLDGHEIRVTVSIGGTLIKPNEPIEDVVKRADRCMYQSKLGGRNLVTIE